MLKRHWGNVLHQSRKIYKNSSIMGNEANKLLLLISFLLLSFALSIKVVKDLVYTLTDREVIIIILSP